MWKESPESTTAIVNGSSQVMVMSLGWTPGNKYQHHALLPASNLLPVLDIGQRKRVPNDVAYAGKLFQGHRANVEKDRGSIWSGNIFSTSVQAKMTRIFRLTDVFPNINQGKSILHLTG